MSVLTDLITALKLKAGSVPLFSFSSVLASVFLILFLGHHCI
jgi:hypothetical protein